MIRDIDTQEILDHEADYENAYDDIDFDDIEDYEWDITSEEPDVQMDLVDGLTDLIDGMFVESRY